MRAGSLRRPVTLQQVAYTADGAGGQGSPVWSSFGTEPTWAAIIPLSGSELANAQQFTPRINYRVEVRYQSGISPKMRVLDGARVFEIHVVLDIEDRRREMHLLCEELNAP